MSESRKPKLPLDIEFLLECILDKSYDSKSSTMQKVPEGKHDDEFPKMVDIAKELSGK